MDEKCIFWIDLEQSIYKAANATLKLLEENKLDALLTPESSPAQEFKFEIRRASEAAWYELQTNTSKSYVNKAKVAGKFKLRVSAKFSNSLEIYSDEKDLEVQFPSYSDIVGDQNVSDAMNIEWIATLNDASADHWREHGFWVVINTKAGRYDFTQVKFGEWVSGYTTANIDMLPEPDDSPVIITPLDEPTYTVAWFHTHTPTLYFPVGSVRGVGPSEGDETFGYSLSFEVPGIAFDYVGDASGNAPAGWPLQSPAKPYPVPGVTRRSTPQ